MKKIITYKLIDTRYMVGKSSKKLCEMEKSVLHSFLYAIILNGNIFIIFNK